jgi:transposase
MLCVSLQSPMAGRWELSEEQWLVVESVPRRARRADNRGRPWQDTRSVLNGVFWVLGTGAQRRELPEKYPPFQTCHRRFQQWIRSGKLVEAQRLLARHLHERGRLNLDEAFVDATFASAKKGAIGPTRRGKGTKIIAIAADNSLPLAVSVESASPAECRLMEDVLAGSFLDQLPAWLIGDKAYDSDPLDEKLATEYGIELIAPNRRGRKRRTQDGHQLRRYRKRWKVERLFDCLQQEMQKSDADAISK